MSLFLVLVVSSLYYSGDIVQLSNWFNASWSGNFNVKALVDHLLLIKSFAYVHNNPVLWSLVHEMRISLIFPLIAFIVIKLSWKKALGVAFFFSTRAFIFYITSSKPNNHDYFQTIHYISMFIVGAILARNKEYLIKYFGNLSTKFKYTLLGLGLFVYLYAKPAFALGIIFGSRDAFLATILDSWVVTLGASILIILSLSVSKISKLLLLKPIHYLGEISYSLYLYHCIVLFTFIHLYHGKIHIGLIWVLSFIISIIVATISYKFVEVPSMRLGKKLVRLVQIILKQIDAEVTI